MAKEMLEKISGDELLRQKYYAREKARLDEISRIKYAEIKGEKQGRARGIVEGRKEGIEQGIKTVAKKLLKEGAETSLVVKATGLTEEEVEKLKAEI